MTWQHHYYRNTGSPSVVRAADGRHQAPAPFADPPSADIAGPHQACSKDCTQYTHCWAVWPLELHTNQVFTIMEKAPPLSTGSLYPKFRGQSSGIIQKLYETKTNTNTGWFKSVYWLFSEIKPKMCDLARFHCFSSKNDLNCNMTFR